MSQKIDMNSLLVDENEVCICFVHARLGHCLTLKGKGDTKLYEDEEIFKFFDSEEEAIRWAKQNQPQNVEALAYIRDSKEKEKWIRLKDTYEFEKKANEKGCLSRIKSFFGKSKNS